MYDQFLRNTTNHLQDDLRTTMRAYNSEKERLMNQLSYLHYQNSDRSDRSETAMSMDSFGGSTSISLTSRRSQYYRAPNHAVSSTSDSSVTSSNRRSDNNLLPLDKKWREKRDIEKMKKDRELFKLPVIHSASTKRSQWESGKLVSKSGNLSGLEPLPGIVAAKSLLTDTLKIPSIYDPTRSDTAFDTSRSRNMRNMRKKVTFADQPSDSSKETSKHIETPKPSSESRTSKNSVKRLVVPRLKLNPNQFGHVARPVRPRKTSLLPPLDVSPKDFQTNPQKVTDGVNEWKSVYSTIVDPEERTRALNDILHAVRMKKHENEQVMKYGNSPRPEDKSMDMKDFFSMSNVDRILYRDENGQPRKGMMPAPRNTAARMGRRSNTQQLQHYLRQMTRSRRMIDHLTAEEYRLANISGHKALQAAMKDTPRSVEVKN